MKNLTSGILVLSDGTAFEGISVGKIGIISGEVVFNTAQTGYQEVLTDPSYMHQLIVFTQPHIGNVGVNALDMESNQVLASGVIMHHLSLLASNWRSEQTLQHFLQKQEIIALSGIDTRALTHHLRQFGSQPGCIMTGEIDYATALNHAKNFSKMIGEDLGKKITTKQSYSWGNPENFANHLVVYDFGVKRSILNCLANAGFFITVVPAHTSINEILATNPKGVVLSNGPGDPRVCIDAIEITKSLLKHQIPLMAICLGHQLLALASGAQIQKMIFGHHGTNHPIKNLKNHSVSISSQNHGFVVAEQDLPDCLNVTHRSLFDNTIVGIERKDVPAFGFQGHPEAGPGPTELMHLFNQFKSMIEVHHAQKN